MAFPVVASVNANVSAASTSQTVNLPASISAGDLLIAFGVATSLCTYTWPAGWTEMWDPNSQTGFTGAYRIADGSEGASITVTASVSFVTTYATLRITGAHASTPPEDGTPAMNVGTTTPNPPSVTASWGAEDNLWIAIMGSSSSAASNVTAYPTNFSDNQTAVDTGSGGLLGYATRNLANATQDPGTFTQSAGTTCGAQTIVVRPAAAGGIITRSFGIIF